MPNFFKNIVAPVIFFSFLDNVLSIFKLAARQSAFTDPTTSYFTDPTGTSHYQLETTKFASTEYIEDINQQIANCNGTFIDEMEDYFELICSDFITCGYECVRDFAYFLRLEGDIAQENFEACVTENWVACPPASPLAEAFFKFLMLAAVLSIICCCVWACCAAIPSIKNRIGNLNIFNPPTEENTRFTNNKKPADDQELETIANLNQP